MKKRCICIFCILLITFNIVGCGAKIDNDNTENNVVIENIEEIEKHKIDDSDTKQEETEVIEESTSIDDLIKDSSDNGAYVDKKDTSEIELKEQLDYSGDVISTTIDSSFFDDVEIEDSNEYINTLVDAEIDYSDLTLYVQEYYYSLLDGSDTEICKRYLDMYNTKLNKYATQDNVLITTWNDYYKDVLEDNTENVINKTNKVLDILNNKVEILYDYSKNYRNVEAITDSNNEETSFDE